ncbi:ABC transporter permease [Candidatus Micrarchaeota archaeon]|nr:ABC transporter permease [Candidatus Micrarchaeota archaeon]
MAIEPSKVYAVWLREVKRFTNSKSRIIGSLGMPLLFLIALGGGLSAMVPGFNYQAFILPGILAMTLLFTSVFSGVSIIWDREFGFLKEMLAAPASRETIVIGRTLGGATTAILQGSIIMVLGIFITGIPIPAIANLIGIFALMVIFSCFLVAVGIAFASVVQEVETFQLIMNLLVMPLFFLSNALFPIDKMPEWLRVVSMFNPISYAVDGLRGLLINTSQFSIMLDFGVSAAALVISITVASYLFSKTSI